MNDLRVSTAMLCLKDYKAAFDTLRQLYEEEVQNRLAREADASFGKFDQSDILPNENSADKVMLKDPSLPDESDMPAKNSMKRECVCVNCRCVDEELFKVRSELEEATERLWSQREESFSETMKLKHSLHVSELERTRLQGLVDHLQSKRRSRSSTPQAPPDELLVARNELERSHATIANLEAMVANLEASQSVMKEKYTRLKSKYRTITHKLKSGLIEQINQAKSNPPTRSVSLLQLYLYSTGIMLVLIPLVQCFRFRFPVRKKRKVPSLRILHDCPRQLRSPISVLHQSHL